MTRVPTHICLDCGALGFGGYHDHGGGEAGDTCSIEELRTAYLDVVRQLESSREPSTRRTSRPGGRQVSYARGVRALSWGLLDDGFVGTERQAQRLARKWLTRALPAKQKYPRQRPADLREAA